VTINSAIVFNHKDCSRSFTVTGEDYWGVNVIYWRHYYYWTWLVYSDFEGHFQLPGYLKSFKILNFQFLSWSAAIIGWSGSRVWLMLTLVNKLKLVDFVL